jgi:hypothetical protein
VSVSSIQTATGNDIYIALARKFPQRCNILPAAGVGAIHRQITVPSHKFPAFTDGCGKIIQQKIVAHRVGIVHKFAAVGRRNFAQFSIAALIAQINKKVFVGQYQLDVSCRNRTIHTLYRIRHLSTCKYSETGSFTLYNKINLFAMRILRYIAHILRKKSF